MNAPTDPDAADVASIDEDRTDEEILAADGSGTADDDALRGLEALRRVTGNAVDSGTSISPVGALLRDVPAMEVPDRVGRFRLEKLLGRGGHGVVWLAFDPNLNRHVALKVPGTAALLDPEIRKRFLGEGKAAAELNHPHLVPVYEAGEEGGICYLASRFCAGPTLAEWLSQHEPMSPREAARLVAVLAEAVHSAHLKGVSHRDLKPGNILLERPLGRADDAPLFSDELADCARVADFGLARLDSGENETATGTVLGTPGYMAPEQARGRSRDAGPAADVHALGVILFELLTGAPPFRRETPAATVRAVAEEPAPSPRRSVSAVPLDLDAICLKCLEKEQQRRYSSAADLAGDLRRFDLGEPIRARRITRWERLRRWCRRNPVVAALSSGVFVLLVGLAITFAVAASRLADQRDEINENYTRAVDAEGDARLAEQQAKVREFEATMATAKLAIRGGGLGQHFAALESLDRSVALVKELDLRETHRFEQRNETIKALIRPDFKFVRNLPGTFGDKNDPTVFNRFAFAPDLSFAAVMNATRKGVEIRDLQNEDSEPVAVPLGVERGWTVHQIQISACGRFLIAALLGPMRLVKGRYTRDQRTLSVWSLGMGKPSRTTRIAHDEQFHWVLSPNAKQSSLAIVQPHGTGFRVQVRSLETGRVSIERVLPAKFDSVREILWRPTTNELGVFDGSSMHLYDFKKDEPVTAKEMGSPAVFAWSADGEMLALVDRFGTYRIWVPRTGSLLDGNSVPGTKSVRLVRFLPTAPSGAPRLLISADTSIDPTTTLWDALEGRLLFRSDGDVAALSADGRHAVFRPLGGRVGKWEITPGIPPRSITLPDQLPQPPTPQFVSKDGRWMISAFLGGRVTVADLTFARTTELPRNIFRGYRAFAVRQTDGLAKLYGIKSDNVIDSWHCQEQRFGHEIVLQWRRSFGLKIPPVNARLDSAIALVPLAEPDALAVIRRTGNDRRWVHYVHAIRGTMLREASFPNAERRSPYCQYLLRGDRAYFQNARKKAAIARDLKTKKNLAIEFPKTDIFAADEHGERIAFVMREVIHVYRATNGKRLYSIPRSPWKTTASLAMPLLLSKKHDLLIIGDRTEIKLHSLSSGRALAVLPSSHFVRESSFRLSDDGARLIEVQETGAITVWDLDQLRAALRKLDLDWSEAPLPQARSAALPLRVDFRRRGR